MDSSLEKIKICSCCLKEKDILMFNKNGKYLRSICRDCGSRNLRKYYNENREKFIERKNKAVKSGIHSVWQKEWYNNNKNNVRKRNLKVKYGNSEIYEVLVEKFGEKCSICLVEIKNLFVDHCHDTGIVRGLLCRNCNTGIGMLKDNPEILIKAAEYVRRFK